MDSPIGLTILLLAAGVMHTDNWDCVYSTWTLTNASLSALFLDYGNSISDISRALIEENSSRAVQPLLVEYVFINGMFERFHNRQIDEINNMKQFVGLEGVLIKLMQ
jgi:hypothetical protein